MSQQNPNLIIDDPKWLAVARQYVGLRELPGTRHHSTILRWLDALKAPFRDDETPWCGTFVGGVIEEAGYDGIKNPWGARNWLKLGVELDRPAYGAVVVFWRGSPKGWAGHVGFVVGRDRRQNLMVLGGNQGNAVSIAPFSPTRVLGYRWPGIKPYDQRYILPLLESDGRVSTNEA